MTSLEKQFAGYRLTTAEITYRLPDFPEILQHYIWQDLDIAPSYPVLNEFLDFWEHSLDGKLHSVRMASSALVKPAGFRKADLSALLH